MVTSAVLFAIAAIGGATMAGMRLQGRDLPPLWLALVHGVVAAAGLIFLIYTVVTVPGTPATAKGAMGGFIVAALGGFVLLLLFHLKNRALPVPVVLIHGFVAVASFVTLLAAILLR